MAFQASGVISCGDGIGGRWRAELDFRSPKPFDDQHRPTALGQSQRSLGLLVEISCSAYGSDPEPSNRKQSGKALARLQLARSRSYGCARKTFGEQAQQEATQELIERDRQQFLFVVVSRIASTAMGGYRYAMGMATEVLQHKLWAAEGWFQINDLRYRGRSQAAKIFG